MIHKDVYIYPDLVKYPTELTSAIRYQSHSLSQFLQRTVLTPLKFETNFRRLCVIGVSTPRTEVLVNTSNVAVAEVPFDQEVYEKLDSVAARQEYFIDMLEAGLASCAAYHPVAGDELLSGVQCFRDGNYLNEWVHSTKQIKQARASAQLRCSITEDAFRLRLVVTKGKTTVFDEVILETLPDVLLFAHKFKGLHVSGETVSVTSRKGPALLEFSVSS